VAEYATTRMALPEPFDLARTVAAASFGSRDATTVVRPDAVWRATRTPSGPASLCVRVRDGEAQVHAAGPGAAAALALAPRLLGLDDAPERFVPRTTFVRDLAHRFRGLRLTAGLPLSEMILPWILGQRVTTAEAKTSWGALLHSHGEPAPDAPDFPAPPTPLRLVPDPARFGRLDPADLGRLGIDRARAATLLEACRHHPLPRRSRLAEPVGSSRKAHRAPRDRPLDRRPRDRRGHGRRGRRADR
jgi:3-methyladenine DNA glycosylase/8-oxoguanine DNA glycosylase